MTELRKAFHERMDLLVGLLGEMVALAEVAMRDATVALFTADTSLAESVISGHDELRARQAEADDLALSLLAREQPVATDLRTIVACLRMSVDVRRMGKLAVHIAEITRDRCPDTTVPTSLWAVVHAMSARALALVARAARAFTSGDGVAADLLDQDDEKVDSLRRELYRTLLTGTVDVEVAVAVEIALLGRYLERFADHAVALGHDVAYLTGRAVLDAERP